MKYLSYYIKNKISYEVYEMLEIKVQVPDDAPLEEIFQNLKNR